MREYDLLAGILANQLRLVSRGTLVRYAALLAQQPGLSLLSYLHDSKALSDHDQELLCRIVDSIVHAHKGDEKAALRAFGGDDAASEAFAGSLAHTEQGWGPTEDQTILSRELPHGLPAQVTPETIGRYTRGSEYARGGIGRILLVHDEQIGRDVILKELLPEHTTSPTDSTLSRLPEPDSPRSPMRQSAAMMARFLQEAKVTGQLEHPSIVPVYELGTRKDGQLYYTMKLVRGETLSESIKKCRDARDRLGLLRSFLDVCNAMAYAHSKGVIHRDLKPSNIMVGEFGECVVLDWGLAKMQKDLDAHREALEKTISQLKLGDEKTADLNTRSKDILGTPLYMAPEQARGEVDAVGVQSDVYSLGVILFEILTGELPHPWTNSIDTIRRVGTLPAPPIRKNAPHTPPELAAICDKALSFHATKRYASARELAADIQSFLEGAVVGAYAYSFFDMLARLYRKHKPIILTATAAAALLLVLGTASYIQIYRARDAEEVARLVAQDQQRIAESQRETAEDEREKAEAAKNEAEAALALASRRQYLSQLRLAQAHIEDQQLRMAVEALDTTPVAERDWAWKYLYNQARPELYTAQSQDSRVRMAFYDPSGQFIVSVREGDVPAVWLAENGEFVRALEGPVEEYNDLAFSQDGKRVAAVAESGKAVVWDLQSGKRLQEFQGPDVGLAVAVNAKGDKVWAAHIDRDVMEWDGTTGEAGPIFKTNDREAQSIYVVADDGVLFGVLENEDAQAQPGIIAWSVADGKVAYEIPGIRAWPAPDRKSFVAVEEVQSTRTIEENSASETWYRLVVRDAATGELRTSMPPSPVDVFHVSFSAEGDRFVSTAVNGELKLWDPASPDPLRRLLSAPPSLFAFLTANGTEVLGCTSTNNFITWDAATGREILRFSGQNGATGSVALSPDRRRVLATPGHKNFNVYDVTKPPGVIATSRVPSIDGKSPGSTTGLTISADESTAAVINGYQTIRLLDLSSLTWISEFTAKKNSPTQAVLTPDAARLIYLDDENTITLGNVHDGTTEPLLTHDKPITTFALSTNGTLLALAIKGGPIELWDIDAKTRLREIPADAVVYSLGFSPDDTILFAGLDNGKLLQRSTADGTTIAEFEAHSARVMSLAVSPTGGHIATAGPDGVVNIWNLPSHERFTTFPIDESFNEDMRGRVSMRFSRDGRYLTIHNQLDRTIVVDMKDGNALLPPMNRLRLDVLENGDKSLTTTAGGVFVLNGNSP